MKTFRMYKHPDLGMEAVKVGFSWPAFFFGIIWMVYKSLWKYAGVWFVFYLVMAFVDNSIKSSGVESGLQSTYEHMVTACYLIIMIIPGFLGNSWRESRLKEKGYVLETTVRSPSYFSGPPKKPS